ncbi:UNVERIFIED_CONTAM: Calcium-transporting ATPase 12, plasma membrane-type [Sesamum calycinum]|uniref:Calcium-transporting ATPase 12, plasma membrane-type n=1 Tax=Sesamum calycinum TaxID=2727403 RepID=A0AAW2RBK1_9LAMI
MIDLRFKLLRFIDVVISILILLFFTCFKNDPLELDGNFEVEVEFEPEYIKMTMRSGLRPGCLAVAALAAMAGKKAHSNLKQPLSHSGAKNSSMASSSLSVLHYRQPERKSVTRYHQMPPEVHEYVIEMGTGNQQGPGSGSSTVDQSMLSKLVKDKRNDEVARLGGVEGIATSLKTDLQQGTGGDVEDISWRTKAFGTNSYAKPPKQGLFSFVWKNSLIQQFSSS